MKPVPGQVWTDKKRTFLGLPWSFTRYILTEKKLITRKGFFTIREDEVELYRIMDKSLRISFGQRLDGTGTVILNCKDVDTPVKELKSIRKPREFMTILEKYVDDQRDKYAIRGRDILGGAAHEHDDALCDTDHQG